MPFKQSESVEGSDLLFIFLLGSEPRKLWICEDWLALCASFIPSSAYICLFALSSLTQDKVRLMLDAAESIKRSAETKVMG